MKPRAPVSLRVIRSLTSLLYALQHTGLPRFAEWIRKRTATSYQDSKRPADYWIDDFMGQLEFRCDLRDHMGSQIFFRKAYSYDQLRLVQRLLSGPSVFVDVGANQGEFSVFVASLSDMNTVLAFEPTSQMRQRLSANIEANGLENVRIFDVGLSNSPQEQVPIYGGSNSGEDGTYHSGLPTIFSIPDRKQLLESITLRTLDETLQSLSSVDTVDLVKVDVEGAELHVFEGALQTISQDRPLIIFEANAESSAAAGYSTSDLFQFLESLNYVLQTIGTAGRLTELDRNCSFCNVLGVPEERLSALMRTLAEY